MKTILVCGQKGGIGKTTITTNLSTVLPGTTAIVDLDPQASALNWARLRNKNKIGEGPSAVRSNVVDLEKMLKAATVNGVDFCIVDTVGTSNAILGEAARYADLIIIPTRPNSMDLTAIGTTLNLLKGNRARQIVVLNMVSRWGWRDTRAVKAIQNAGGVVAPVRLSSLLEYSEAIVYGQAVHEYAPRGKGGPQIKWLGEITVEFLRAA